ncbi:hypothetical protein GCM10025867_48450 (plasmid) [Frondihabitans sucicola]|uniref:Uncharacterized protein n=1 Tax=Frondihabitans sucicola TaxID=1268041 RepID=A0ABN6Y5J8_9MICO|nr:hypothetical protein [Frondihabitans sucicola]BDZ52604.1 hypothetical protein GCM10025867_48450 [Frondihabitans sucicola]
MSGDSEAFPTGKVVGAVAGAIALFVVLYLVFGVIGRGLGWFDAKADVISAPNVKAQTETITKDWAGLVQSADNACSAVNAATTSNSPTMIEDPAQAYAATYRSIVADYNATMANDFKAKDVAPTGYPTSIPNFDETHGAKPDWCAVSTKLADLKAAA